jgi:hypothetical protein
MIGEPMGVLPTKARDHRAMTRPRSCGSEASWTVELPVVRNSYMNGSELTEETRDTLGGSDPPGPEGELGGPDPAGTGDDLGGLDPAGPEDEMAVPVRA